MVTSNERLLALFKEVFFGTAPGASGTWFVQGGEAMFDTLDGLNAAQASKATAPGVSSMAAHAIHTAYYLELAIDGYNSLERASDWAGSWTIQVVDEEGWSEIRASLREKVGQFVHILETADFACKPNDEFYAMANIAHASYHLGAIRQIYLSVS